MRSLGRWSRSAWKWMRTRWVIKRLGDYVVGLVVWSRWLGGLKMRFLAGWLQCSCEKRMRTGMDEDKEGEGGDGAVVMQDYLGT